MLGGSGAKSIAQKQFVQTPDSGISMKHVGQTAPRRTSGVAKRGARSRTSRVLVVRVGCASAGTSAPQRR
ncbi:hypothetical protein LQK93_01622 [Terrabacter sp. BE26]